MIEAAGHLALWNAGYAAAVAIAGAQLLGLRLPAVFLVWAFLTAWAGFLLDRVKLRDRDIEAGDRLASPERTRFLGARSGRWRVLMAAVAAGALASGVVVQPWAAPLSVLSWAGVSAYSARFGRPEGGGGDRLKDVFLLKNALVGAAFAVLAVATVAAEGRGLGQWGEAGALAAMPVSVWVFLLVAADAMVCDVGDEPGDRAMRTRTVAVRFGARAAWRVAAVMHAIAAFGLIAASAGGLLSGASLEVVAWWSVTPAVGLALAAITARRKPRDLIDARLGAAGLAAAWVF